MIQLKWYFFLPQKNPHTLIKWSSKQINDLVDVTFFHKVCWDIINIPSAYGTRLFSRICKLYLTNMTKQHKLCRESKWMAIYKPEQMNRLLSVLKCTQKFPTLLYSRSPNCIKPLKGFFVIPFWRNKFIVSRPQ